MAIVLNDYKPSGDVEEIVFPGSKERFEIPTAEDVLTVEILEQLSQGDYSAIVGLFPAKAQKLFKGLHLSQVKQFVEAWTGSAKN